MKIIGITGPIGSGKSYVASLIAKHGIAHLDTDEIYHELIAQRSECTEKIREYFGDEVIAENGSVDRKVLSRIVFADKKKLERLNEITHICVTKRTNELFAELEANGEKAVLVEVPIMFESGFNKLCDSVICVTADRAVRLSRIMKRNALSQSEAESRINNQKSEEFYIENSDITVYNNGTEDLNAQIELVLQKVLA